MADSGSESSASEGARTTNNPRPPDNHRDALGRRVREVWILWAQEQPDPKASWLVPYDELSEDDKEADRCIGSALWGDGFADGQRAMARHWQYLDGP